MTFFQLMPKNQTQSYKQELYQLRNQLSEIRNIMDLNQQVLRIINSNSSSNQPNSKPPLTQRQTQRSRMQQSKITSRDKSVVNNNSNMNMNNGKQINRLYNQIVSRLTIMANQAVMHVADLVGEKQMLVREVIRLNCQLNDVKLDLSEVKDQLKTLSMASVLGKCRNCGTIINVKSDMPIRTTQKNQYLLTRGDDNINKTVQLPINQGRRGSIGTDVQDKSFIRKMQTSQLDDFSNQQTHAKLSENMFDDSPEKSIPQRPKVKAIPTPLYQPTISTNVTTDNSQPTEKTRGNVGQETSHELSRVSNRLAQQRKKQQANQSWTNSIQSSLNFSTLPVGLSKQINERLKRQNRLMSRLLDEYEWRLVVFSKALGNIGQYEMKAGEVQGQVPTGIISLHPVQTASQLISRTKIVTSSQPSKQLTAQCGQSQPKFHVTDPSCSLPSYPRLHLQIQLCKFAMHNLTIHEQNDQVIIELVDGSQQIRKPTDDNNEMRVHQPKLVHLEQSQLKHKKILRSHSLEV